MNSILLFIGFLSGGVCATFVFALKKECRGTQYFNGVYSRGSIAIIFYFVYIFSSIFGFLWLYSILIYKKSILEFLRISGKQSCIKRGIT